MTFVELKSSLLGLMKKEFPETEYRYYSMVTEEDFERPSFFTFLQPIEISAENYNTIHHQVAFCIDYRQERLDEEDILNKVYLLEQLFGLNVLVGERAVDITSYTWDYIGAGKNIAQITVNLEWSEKIERKLNTALMSGIKTKMEMEE